MLQEGSVERLQAAGRSPKGGGDKSKVPRCSSQNQFSLQPSLLTPSTERKTAAPGSLPSCGKHGQTCSSKALGPAWILLVLWHPTGVILALRPCLYHRPQAWDSKEGNDLLSLGQLVTFISACDDSGWCLSLSSAHTGAEFSFHSDFCHFIFALPQWGHFTQN